MEIKWKKKIQKETGTKGKRETKNRGDKEKTKNKILVLNSDKIMLNISGQIKGQRLSHRI